MDVAEQARARERSGSSADIPGPSSAQATSAPAAVTNLQPRRSVKEPALPWVIILLLAVAFVGLQAEDHLSWDLMQSVSALIFRPCTFFLAAVGLMMHSLWRKMCLVWRAYKVKRESRNAATEAEGHALDAEARMTLAENNTAAMRYRNILAEAKTARARKISTAARRRAMRAATRLAAAQLAVLDAERRTAAAAATAATAAASCATAAAATASCATAAATAVAVATAAAAASNVAAAPVAESPSLIPTVGNVKSRAIRRVQAVTRKEEDEEEKGEEKEEKEEDEEENYLGQAASTRRTRVAVTSRPVEVVSGEARTQKEKRHMRNNVNHADEPYTDNEGRPEEHPTANEQRSFVGRTHLLPDVGTMRDIHEVGAAQESLALNAEVRRNTIGEGVEEVSCWQSLHEKIAQSIHGIIRFPLPDPLYFPLPRVTPPAPPVEQLPVTPDECSFSSTTLDTFTDPS